MDKVVVIKSSCQGEKRDHRVTNARNQQVRSSRSLCGEVASCYPVEDEVHNSGRTQHKQTKKEKVNGRAPRQDVRAGSRLLCKSKCDVQLAEMLALGPKPDLVYHSASLRKLSTLDRELQNR